MSAAVLAILAEIILSGTVITLHPSLEPGALAEVVMQNIPLNGPADEQRLWMEIDQVGVWIGFDWNSAGDADAITVEPPEGVMCKPASCVLELPEGESGRLLLYVWAGM